MFSENMVIFYCIHSDTTFSKFSILPSRSIFYNIPVIHNHNKDDTLITMKQTKNRYKKSG